jgi:hypothetical protein
MLPHRARKRRKALMDRLEVRCSHMCVSLCGFKVRVSHHLLQKKAVAAVP